MTEIRCPKCGGRLVEEAGTAVPAVACYRPDAFGVLRLDVPDLPAHKHKVRCQDCGHEIDDPMFGEADPWKGAIVAQMADTPEFELNVDAISTLDDVRAVLGALQIRFTGNGWTQRLPAHLLRSV